MTKKQSDQGGILFTALVMTMFVSFLLVIITENYQLSKKFVYHTRNYYLAQTMKNLSLNELKATNASSGTMDYSVGTVTFKRREDNITFLVNVGTTSYKFHERQPEGKNSSIEKERTHQKITSNK